MQARKPPSPVQRSSKGSSGASHGCRKPVCAALFAEQGLQASKGRRPSLWLHVSIDLEGKWFLVKGRGQEGSALWPVCATACSVTLGTWFTSLQAGGSPSQDTEAVWHGAPLGSTFSAPSPQASLPPAPLSCSLSEYAHSPPIRGGQELPSWQSTVIFNFLRCV